MRSFIIQSWIGGKTMRWKIYINENENTVPVLCKVCTEMMEQKRNVRRGYFLSFKGDGRMFTYLCIYFLETNLHITFCLFLLLFLLFLLNCYWVLLFTKCNRFCKHMYTCNTLSTCILSILFSELIHC